MFNTPTWEYKRGFITEPLTGGQIKDSALDSTTWNARAYTAPIFLDAIANAGFRNYHNDNDLETTEYVIGISNREPSAVLRPSDLDFGLWFYNDKVSALTYGIKNVGWTDIPVQNSVYYARFDSTNGIHYFVGNDETAAFDDTGLDFVTADYRFYIFAKVAFNTVVQTQVNIDGTDRYQITDITYKQVDATDTQEISILDQDTDFFLTVPKLTVYGKDFDPTTITNDTVKMWWLGDTLNARQEVNIEIIPKGSANNFEISFRESLRPLQYYTLEIGMAGLPVVSQAGSGSTEYELYKFVTRTAPAYVEDATEVVFNTLANDIYFKANHLTDLLDVDELIYRAQEKFDFTYNVTEYNPQDKTYNILADPAKAGEFNQNRTLTFENSRIMEKLLFNEFLPEYTTYLADINSISVANGTDPKTILNLKAMLLRNVTLMNYFKGNKVQMEFLITVFSDSIGYHFVKVDPDPYYNFIYRISTTLPRAYWENDIKHITHPLGWDDFYVEIPADATSPFDIRIIDEHYFWEHMKFPPTYLDIAQGRGGDTGITTGRFLHNAVLEDMNSSEKVGFKPQDTTADVQYLYDQTDGLFWELAQNLPEVTLDETSVNVIGAERPFYVSTQTVLDGYNFHLELLKTGTMMKYQWELSSRGVKFLTKTTNAPELNFKITNNDSNIEVTLRGLHGTEQFYMYKFILRPYRPTRLKEAYSQRKRAYLEVNVEEKSVQWDNAVIDDFLTQYEARFKPNYYLDNLDTSALDTTFIQPATISSTAIAGAAAGSTRYRISVSIPEGIVGKYEWTLYDSSGGSAGNPINTINSNQPYIIVDLDNARLNDTVVKVNRVSILDFESFVPDELLIT